MKKFKPETEEEVKLTSTPKGMREYMIQNANNFPFPIVYHVLKRAEYENMSSEDTMTILALNALVQLEIVMDNLLNMIRNNPSAYIVKNTGQGDINAILGGEKVKP